MIKVDIVDTVDAECEGGYMSPLKVFIAGSGQDRYRVCGVANLLEEQLPNSSVFDWWSSDEWDAPTGPVDPVAVAEADLGAVSDSHVLVWYLSDKSSQGAPLEVGYALALGVPVFVLDRTIQGVDKCPNAIYPKMIRRRSFLADRIGCLLDGLRAARQFL